MWPTWRVWTRRCKQCLPSHRFSEMKHSLKPVSFNVGIRLITFLVLTATASGISAQTNENKLTTFKSFVNGEAPVKEAVVYRELSNTNGTVLNREWWRFGYQHGTWFVQRLMPDAANEAKLVPKDSTICGASFAQFWIVTDKNLHIAANDVATGSLPVISSQFQRSLMFCALSLGVPRDYDALNITNAFVKWDGLNFTTIVGTKRDHHGVVLATGPLNGHLTLGTNGLPASAEFSSVGQFRGGRVTFEYAPDTVGIPRSFTERYENTKFHYEFMSLVLGSNDLAQTDGYEPSAFADLKLKRTVTFYTNEFGYEQRDGMSYPSFRPTAPKPGTPAPKLQGSMWLNVARPLTLDSLRGKVVLLDFWSIHCPPCIEAFPSIEALHNKFKNEGLVVIGVCSGWGDEKRLDSFLAEHDVTYPNMVDTELQIADLRTGYTSRSYVLDANPSYALIDRAGNLVWRSAGGFLPTEAQIKSLLDRVPPK